MSDYSTVLQGGFPQKSERNPHRDACDEVVALEIIRFGGDTTFKTQYNIPEWYILWGYPLNKGRGYTYDDEMTLIELLEKGSSIYLHYMSTGYFPFSEEKKS